MASDLATALLSGNASALAADPAMMQALPQLQLAQTMLASGLSGAPAYPMQAIGRLAQALVGGKMMNDATADISNVYGGATESLKRVFPEGTTLGDMLRSNSPYVRMMAVQQASKAALLNSETKTLGPEQTVVAPKTPAAGGGVVAAGSPQQAGAVAKEKAPYEAGGEVTIPGGPSGVQKIPATAATRAAMQPQVGVPVNPLSVNGQPQNLTGPIIPPGGANAQPPAQTVVKPSSLAAPPAPPKMPEHAPQAPGSFQDRFDEANHPTPNAQARAQLGGVPVETPAYKAQMETAGKVGAAIGGTVAEHIEAGGKSARDRMNALDSIESAMRTNEGKGMVTGPQAESILKWRETLDGLGIKSDWVKTGMPQSEMVQKMNAQLASASAKAMTGRPTQFEFQAWQRNNPGLMTSREGSLALLNVLRQTTQQEIDIGKLAQDKANWNHMPDVIDRYYAQHPLINPFTNRPMRDEIPGHPAVSAGHPAARPPLNPADIGRAATALPPSLGSAPRAAEEEAGHGASPGLSGTTSTGIQWSVR